MTGQLLDFNTAKRQGEATKGQVDAADIRERLHADPRGFINWMFAGRALITKSEARIGNVYGEPGSSLSIDLKTGLWHDHSTGEGSDLIGLYRAWRGFTGTADFQLSLKEIAHDYLGDPVEVERSAWKPTAHEQIDREKAKLGTKPREDMLELGAPVADYKYFDLRGNIIASVVRFEPDGTRESKTFRPWCFRDGKWTMGAPDLRPLYRLPELATSQHVVLCEGEGCAEALTRLGIVATTAMQGAKAPIDKTDWSPLAGKTVTIWPDNDPPGFDYAKRVSERLLSLGCTVLGISPSDRPAKWDAADAVAEGIDVHAVIAGASPVQAKPKPRVRLLTIAELATMAPPSWLVDGILTVGGLSMLWGRSGSLKSFAALDQALCIATGMDWHGRPVKKGRVVYLAAEGAHGLGSRAFGWLKTRGRECAEPDFQIVPHGLTLVSDEDLSALIDVLGEKPVSLIVIDTMSRTFGSGNPNQPADMNAFVSACDRLREATGAHVMVVHHGGKDTDKNELGNEGLRNACDTVIHVRRKQSGIELINEAPKGKQKDFEEFKTINLTPVKVHYQQNETEQHTLILNLSEEAPTPGDDIQRDETPKLGAAERAILKALAEAREPLGLIRLQAMTQVHKGTLHTALGRLVEKDMLKKERSEDGKRDVWTTIL